MADETAPQHTGRLKSGNPHHQLTREDCVKGAYRVHEIRRERAKTVRDHLADKARQEADAIYASFSEALKNGDWRAAQALLAEAFGKPISQLELTGKLDNTLQITVQSTLPTPAADTPPALTAPDEPEVRS